MQKFNESFYEKHDIENIVKSVQLELDDLKAKKDEIIKYWSDNKLFNCNRLHVFNELDFNNMVIYSKLLVEDVKKEIISKYSFFKRLNYKIDEKTLIEKLKEKVRADEYLEVENRIDEFCKKYKHELTLYAIRDYMIVTSSFKKEYNEEISKLPLYDIDLEWNRFRYNLMKCDTYMEMDAFLGKYLSPDWVNINSIFTKL